MKKDNRLPIGDTSYIRKDFKDFGDFYELRSFLYFIAERHGCQCYDDVHAFEGKFLLKGVTGFVLNTHNYFMNFTIFDLYLLLLDDVCEEDAGFGGNRVLVYESYLKEYKEKSHV